MSATRFEHKYHVRDMNGFLRATATTKPCALKRARALADDTGLDMQVCYPSRTWLGTIHHVLNVRCRDARKLARRHYTLNGQAFISDGRV